MMKTSTQPQLFPAPASWEIFDTIQFICFEGYEGAAGTHKGTNWLMVKETTTQTYTLSPQLIKEKGYTHYWECDINGWLLRDTDIKEQLEGFTKMRIWWSGGTEEKIGELTNGNNTFARGSQAEKLWLKDNGFVPNLNPKNPYFVNNKKGWVALHTPLYFYVALRLFGEGECDFLLSCEECDKLIWVDVKMNDNTDKNPNRFIKFASEKNVLSGWLRATNSGKKVMVSHFDNANTNEWLHIKGTELRAEVEDTPVDKRMLNGGSLNNQKFHGSILLSLATNKAVWGYSSMGDTQLQMEIGRRRNEIEDVLAPMERAVIITHLQERCLSKW